MDSTQVDCTPMLTPLIGIASNAPGAGKSTIATELARVLDGVRMSFAQPIRDMAATFLQNFDVGDRCLFAGKDEPIPCLPHMTGRDLLMSLGTAWGRGMVGQDIWVDAAMAQASQYASTRIFDDMRFPNEARAIQACGGHLVFIQGPKNSRGAASEGHIRPEDCNVVVRNDHTRPPNHIAFDILYQLFGTPSLEAYTDSGSLKETPDGL